MVLAGGLTLVVGGGVVGCGAEAGGPLPMPAIDAPTGSLLSTVDVPATVPVPVSQVDETVPLCRDRPGPAAADDDPGLRVGGCARALGCLTLLGDAVVATIGGVPQDDLRCTLPGEPGRSDAGQR
ncbi:hypothetical protein [Nakamurella leprariae]|uniref:Uncharacterized protein n=1 Tax=Nakamurella leprariae TaxID=2803911 RepID=A0A938YEA9_9ACTN|nr:hypothetical protein [Nakamurella leprariae]MBM9468259.1 hypothetical protein [Nakamurella leprariae]